MPNLPDDFLSRVRQILLPLVTDVDERELLLTEAFYLNNPVLFSMEREGKPLVFCGRCTRSLLDFGCLKPGEHALARLLAVVRTLTGIDKHAEIDALIQLANGLCAEPAPLPAAVPVMPPITTPPVTIATPRADRRPTVFISYSHADTEFATKLIADLNAAGHACWIDTSEIKGGDEWIMTIADGIINSYAFVPIVTLRALQSRWVQDEILWARQKKKLIIPVILENVFGETRFFPLVSYQGVTVFDRGYAEAVTKLLSYLPAPALPTPAPSEPLPEPEAAPENVTVVAPRSVPRTVELAYLERLQLEELLNTDKYTALGGVSQGRQRQIEMRSVFELLPMKRNHEMQPHKFENAVDEIQRMRRCVLLGEPGGGKTTTLWKLAAELVEVALTDRSAPLPLLIRLGKWTDAQQSLPEFIASQLGDLGAFLAILLAEKRVALLLDGLNELPTGQRDQKYPQVQRFIEQQPGVLAVVSCRELDYTLDLGFDKINITPLDPLRIREFVTRYLGATKGDDLFWKLAGNKAKNYHADFIQQVGQPHEPIFWLADQLPADVKWTYDFDTENQYGYWTNWHKLRENPSGLMVLARNPYMLLMLTSVYARVGVLPENRGELFREFVETLLIREEIPVAEQHPLLDGLAQVAYEMQLRRVGAAGAGSESMDALTVLPEDTVKALLGERLLYLAGSASILSIGAQVRFSHQLLQEYFVARYMDNEIRAGKLQATAIWQSEQWWERTNWEEAVILLAGLYSDDCTPVVNWLADAQPEIAAQCITRSGAAVPDSTLLMLREKWLPRLTDLQNDPHPHARAAVGRALGQITLSDGTPLDNRKGVGVVFLPSPSEGRTMGEGQGVRAIPDIDWVLIPADEFIYGSDDKADYRYGAKPADQKIMALPAFEISRYPITYAQFQPFIDDPEGYYDPQNRWFAGLSADTDDRELEEQYFKYRNHPRETVNWYQAIAFCRWYSWRLGGGYDLNKIETWAVRLPTEYEWEKAARANTGWVYPYGNKFDAKKGNADKTGIRQTSAVGIFPDGASPYGILDMSGNVWEWCLSAYDAPKEQAADEDISTNVRRVLRGGSWNNFNSDSFRAASRNGGYPHIWNNLRGFRFVCYYK